MTTLELFNGDCLEIMKGIPDASIDLIICDLPYGCLTTGVGKKKINRADNPSKTNNRTSGILVGCQWDVKIDLEKFWEQVKRIRRNKHSACIHFCNTRFGVDLINSNPKEFRYDMVWNKMRGVGFLSANKKPMTSHEMIYIFGKEGAAYNRIDENTRCVLSVIENYNTSGHSGKQHPTAKPVELYKWLISRYSKEGDTILDPTFGSCNSGIVAMELNRNYIGIEMNEPFYDKAVNWFE